MANIIVIDDDRFMAEQMVETLQVAGFDAIGTRYPRDGIDLIKQHRPALVICDIRMPEMTGFDVLDQIRSDSTTTETPFIFVTAQAERESMRRGMELGAEDYLTKPFSASELIKAVQTQLNKRRIIEERFQSTISLLREQITYALPHELRTPLMGSLGYAELLRMSADQVTPDEIRDLAGEIVRFNERLHRVLENYLVYAQLELIASDPVQVEALRNHLTGNAARVIEEKATDLAVEAGRAADLDVTVEPVALRISADNLEKIVAELVENALKFSPTGSPVRVAASARNGTYSIQVSDAGRGMTGDEIARIGAYMQFGRALHEQQGLGLGLIIARRMIDLHKGEFHIDSHPGEGTLVDVRFPLR